MAKRVLPTLSSSYSPGKPPDIMQKILTSGIAAGIVLLIVSYGLLTLTPTLLPALTDEYFNPAVFQTGNDRIILYFLHPFVLSFALAWFWERFKGLFHSSSFIWRGIELGLVYGLVATLPTMWITFSSMNVSMMMILSWLGYGIIQAIVAGIINAKLNP